MNDTLMRPFLYGFTFKDISIKNTEYNYNKLLIVKISLWFNSNSYLFFENFIVQSEGFQEPNLDFAVFSIGVFLSL